MSKDDLDEFIAEREARSPKFRELLAEAEQRRKIASELAEARRAKGLSQERVATGMATTQSVVSKLEGGGDVRLSTLLKYADAVGVRIMLASKKASGARKAAPARRRRARATK